MTNAPNNKISSKNLTFPLFYEKSLLLISHLFSLIYFCFFSLYLVRQYHRFFDTAEK